MSSQDPHFLERLERAGRPQVELALGLADDHELVHQILRAAELPDAAERVAVGVGEAGPHLLVGRDGQVQTCVAAGTKLGDGVPIIARARLDEIAETLAPLRSLIADTGQGNLDRTRRKLARVLEGGQDVSREQFEDVARWYPLLGVEFLMFHLDAATRAREIAEQLARVKQLDRGNERLDEALHAYWCAAWAVAHLSALIGSDDAGVHALFEHIEPHMPGLALQLPWSAVRLGVMSFALRGAWVASKLPSFVLPPAKRRYEEPNATFSSALTDALSMTAAALRHAAYQAEIAELLDRNALPPERVKNTTELVRMIAAHTLHATLEDPQKYLDHLLAQSRDVMRAYFPTAELKRRIDELPDEVPLAAVSMIPVALHDDPKMIPSMFERLAWIVRIEAPALYLPEDFMSFVRGPWTRDEGLALLRPRIGATTPAQPQAQPRPQPAVANKRKNKIGRNEPCPCGSGRKYKKCCGAPGNSQA